MASDAEATALTLSSEELALLFLSEDRLAVAGALVVRADTTAGLAERTGLAQRAVLGAIGALRTAGFVAAEGDTYAFVPAAITAAARAVRPAPAPMDASMGYGMTDDEVAVLREYFTGTTLRQIPAPLAKLEVVVQRLALEFEPGQRYTESEVNEMLGAFHPDTARLRRELVDLGYLDREATGAAMLYWRSGGRV